MNYNNRYFRKQLNSLLRCSNKILGFKITSSNIARVDCVYGIVFHVLSYYDGYTLYEQDSGINYLLGSEMPDIKSVYERMCEEHGCLR